MFTEILILVLLIFYVVYFLNKKPYRLPPGKWGWPLFGSLPSQDVSLVEQVRELRKVYGDIFTWRIGGNTIIFLCNYETIKVAFNKPELSNRPELFSQDVYSNKLRVGIVYADGKLWKNNRRFALRHLKSLGMGKSTYESVIQQEVSCLINDFEKRVGKPGRVPWSLNVAVLNVIWRITADRRYNVDDEDIQHYSKLVDALFGSNGFIVPLLDLMPWIPKVVPEFLIKWCGAEAYIETATELRNFMTKFVEEHQKVLDPENPRDYIDYYLIEMESQKENTESTMTILDLIISLIDLFIAGSETTSSFLRWAIFHMCKYPDVQTKVQEEIDSVISRSSLPSLQYKDRLPYLDAVCHEVQRIVSLGGLSLPHAASEETTLEGYLIPKGAMIMASLDCCHFDPAYWEKPNEFYPEHFLSQDGKVVSKKEGYVPFSIGKRVCPGESLANMEMYLFLSGLLQKFRFSVPEGEELNPKRNPKDRLVNAPKPFNVIISKRI